MSHLAARVSPHLLDALLCLALVGVTLWRLLPAVDSTEFHRDEARWIQYSALLGEWRNPFSMRWQDEGYDNLYGTRTESNRRRDQPPLAMYAIGLGLLLQGERLPTIGYWIMTEDTDWNRDQGNMPAAAELEAARRVSVIVTVLTVIGLFLLGTRLTNRAGGITAALIYALHPLVLPMSTRAWSDPLLACLVVLAALAAYRFGERPTWGRAAVLGIVLGLGAATKLSPLVVAGALGAIGVALWCLWRAPGSVRQTGLRLAAAPAAAAATLVLAYPYLWRNPVTHTYRLFEWRAQAFTNQAQGFPDAAVPNRGEALRRIGHDLGDRFSTSGAAAEELEQWLGGSLWASLDQLDLVLAALGVLLIVALIVRTGVVSPASLAVAVIGGQALLIVLTMRVEFARYLLPVVLLVATACGVVAGTLWQTGSAWVRHRSPALR